MLGWRVRDTARLEAAHLPRRDRAAAAARIAICAVDGSAVSGALNLGVGAVRTGRYALCRGPRTYSIIRGCGSSQARHRRFEALLRTPLRKRNGAGCHPPKTHLFLENAPISCSRWEVIRIHNPPSLELANLLQFLQVSY